MRSSLVLSTLLLVQSALLLPACAGSMNRLKDDSLEMSVQSGRPEGGPADYRAYAAYLKALEAERTGDFNQAERWLKKAMEYDPKSATLQVQLGKVLAEKRMIAAAIAATRKGLELEPDNFNATLQLAALLQFDDKLSDAEQAYLKAIDISPEREEGYLELANLYRAQKKPADGLALLKRYKEIGGEVGVRMLLLKAALHKDLDQKKEAEADFLAVLDQYPDFTQAQRALLDLYLAEGNLRATADRLEDLFEKNPWLTWVPEALIQLYARLGEVVDLERHLADVSDSDREVGEALRLEAVEELATRRDFDKAMQVLEPMLKQSDNPRALLYAGFLYARKKDYDRAIELFSRIPESSELYVRGIEQRASALQAKGDTDKAITLLKDYLKAEPDSDEVRFSLASTYMQAKRHAEALAVLEEILARSPNEAEAITQKGFVLQDMGRTGEAVTLLREAIAAQKQQVRLYDALALVLSDEGRYNEAVEVLKEAVKVDPENEQIRFSLGAYYDKLKMHEDAIAQMWKILELNENNADAMNFIGYTWAELGVRLSEAETLIKRALELEPNNGYITDSLGWVYFKNGNYPEAVKTLERAVELTSQEPIIVEHLGDAYLKVGEKRKALEVYKRAATEVQAQEKPEPEDVRRILKKLEDLKAELGATSGPARKGTK